MIIPSAIGAEHYGICGFIEYADGSWCPNNIKVTVTNLENNEYMIITTLSGESGRTGYYSIDLYDLDTDDGDTIRVTVSYGGCEGNESEIANATNISVFLNVTIYGNLPPDIPSKPSGPTTGYTNEPLMYSTLSNDPDTPPDQVKYGWDWNNDNNVDEWTNWHNYSQTCNITHYWQQPGTYTIKVKAQDTHGAERGIAWSDPLTITISNRPSPPENKPPGADFTYAPSKPLVNVPVNFTDTSIDKDGYIVRWYWDFGDGTNATDRNTTHTYSKTGNYQVNLTVTDNQYAIDTKTRTISVIRPSTPPPTWKNTTEITLQYNVRNKGNNYLVWKGESITASDLAIKASLSPGEAISIFSKQLGDWQTYIVGKSNALTDDFLISPWDIIIIKCTATKKILTDISKIDATNQTIVIGFTSAGTFAQKGNQGYNFFAWTQNHVLSVKEFIDAYGFSHESVEISKYNVDSNTWSTYNPSLPSEFQDQFTIQVFDIICIKVAQNTPEKELKIT